MTQILQDIVHASDFFIVKNDRGIHTRPATEIVKCMAKFHAEIFISYQKMEVNAKSILGILMLAACRGARIRISARGEDAFEAVEALKELASKQFYIHY